MKNIGWIGTGYMGVPMATNLLQAGFCVNVFNRSSEKAAPLVASGAKAFKSPQEVVKQSDIIFLMLTDGAAIREVLTRQDGVLAAMSSGKVVIDMSTIAPHESREFSALVAEKGGIYFDAPVSGSVGAAETKQLVILAGSKATEAYQPYFDVLGKKTINFGGVGKGTSAKLVINMLLAITAQGAAEALVLAEKLGLELEEVLEMISNSGMNTGMFQSKKAMYRSGQFPAAFMLQLMTKDLGLIHEEVERKNLILPLESKAHETYRQANGNGKGQLDLAAVYLEIHEKNN